MAQGTLPVFCDNLYGKRIDMCVCIIESPCCTVEINHNIVNQLYANKTLKWGRKR